jgi:hypothetical protein
MAGEVPNKMSVNMQGSDCGLVKALPLRSPVGSDKKKRHKTPEQ